MRLPQDIIIKPYITERSNMAIAEGKYTFVVNTKATKTEVRKAVEKLFQVKVLRVSIMNYDGKAKRMGVHQGTTAKWKKAIVKIDLNPKNTTFLAKDGKATATNKKYKTAIDEFGAVQ